MILIFQELLGYAYFFIREFVAGEISLGEGRVALMLARGLQMFAVQGTFDGVLALRSAALGTDLAVYAGTVAARSFLFTQLTGNVHQRTLITRGTSRTEARPGAASLSYHRDMARIDLYVKVELDTDELEPPDRLAEEICRIVSRIYGVRRAEVSNMVEKET